MDFLSACKISKEEGIPIRRESWKKGMVIAVRLWQLDRFVSEPQWVLETSFTDKKNPREWVGRHTVTTEEIFATDWVTSE